MAKSNDMGMQTFDQGLYNLYQAGEITYDDALNSADSANDLRLMIKLASEDPDQLSSATKGLTLQD